MQPPVQPQKMVHALYDFDAMEPDELTLRTGDVINVICASDTNWWRGKAVASGKEGLFPASFVEEEKERKKKSSKTETRKRSKSSSSSSRGTTAQSITHENAEESSNAAATLIPATEASIEAATEATLKIEEEKIKMALHLIQQMDPTKPIEEEEERKLKGLEVECEAMSALINQELEATDRQHLQLMQLNKKMAVAMQMYHFLMVSEAPRSDSTVIL